MIDYNLNEKRAPLLKQLPNKIFSNIFTYLFIHNFDIISQTALDTYVLSSR